ncbi:hypothetical protein EWM64_g10856 [Hericium alpestre]|uniref:Uncharacterized protein n=1 Tax=Hericium alpestre TaxID=135208 RepID=A0A4Y9ZGJ2_9AGAM|nr:hypothetical protein EWM64_g10856 [Hericium alpestre]
MATKFLKPYLLPDEQDDFVIFVQLLEDKQCPLRFIIYAILGLEDESLCLHKSLRWLCLGCLMEMMHRHLHQWLKKERENFAWLIATPDVDNVEDESDLDSDDSEDEDNESDQEDDDDASLKEDSDSSLDGSTESLVKVGAGC